MKKAENVKAPKQKKSVFEKVSQSFAFLVQYMKDANEYEEYKKTNHLKQEKMQKAFANIKISDQQKKEAENLQKKVFLAFDEIDEMSQRYSEDIEAASDIIKNVFSEVWSLLSVGGMGLIGIAVAKGKFPVSKIVNTVVNMGFKKDSAIRTNINDFYNILKQDKSLMLEFQNAVVHGNFNLFIKSSIAKDLRPIYERFLQEIGIIFAGVNPAVPETFKGILNDHLKQGVVAKYVRNLVLQSSELYLKNKNDVPLGKISDYKTLIGTGAVTGIPIIGTIIAIPYMLNAWLTDIQKKAGKIGIMKAMEKIDDPRVFTDSPQ